MTAGDSAALRGLKRIVPRGTRDPLRRGLTLAALPLARRRLAALEATSGVRLHFACGFSPLEGWVNIDLVGARVDVPWDLRRQLPLPDSSVDAIFSEHLFEHLPLGAALSLQQESLRLLAPGGIVRVGVPDAGLLLRSYAGTEEHEWARTAPTPMLAVDALFYEHGHRTMYDAQTLVTVTEAAGFDQVGPRPWGDSDVDPAPDTVRRRGATLYVEGRRPA